MLTSLCPINLEGFLYAFNLFPYLSFLNLSWGSKIFASTLFFFYGHSVKFLSHFQFYFHWHVCMFSHISYYVFLKSLFWIFIMELILFGGSVVRECFPLEVSYYLVYSCILFTLLMYMQHMVDQLSSLIFRVVFIVSDFLLLICFKASAGYPLEALVAGENFCVVSISFSSCNWRKYLWGSKWSRLQRLCEATHSWDAAPRGGVGSLAATEAAYMAVDLGCPLDCVRCVRMKPPCESS